MDLLERMLGHDRWTTDRLLGLCQDLSNAQLDQDFDIGRRSIRETFDHMLRAMEMWTGYMAGMPAPMIPGRESIETMQARHIRSYDRFASIATAHIAAEHADDTFVDRHQVPQSYGGTIIQVIEHNAHHRGEILHMLQRLGKAGLPDGDVQEWEHMTGRIAWTADK